jgi:hypothetical protein
MLLWIQMEWVFVIGFDYPAQGHSEGQFLVRDNKLPFANTGSQKLYFQQ